MGAPYQDDRCTRWDDDRPKKGGLDDPVAQSIRNEQMADAAAGVEEQPKVGSLAHVIEMQKRYNGAPDGQETRDMDDYADLGEAAKEQGIEAGDDE